MIMVNNIIMCLFLLQRPINTMNDQKLPRLTTFHSELFPVAARLHHRCGSEVSPQVTSATVGGSGGGSGAVTRSRGRGGGGGGKVSEQVTDGGVGRGALKGRLRWDGRKGFWDAIETILSI